MIKSFELNSDELSDILDAMRRIGIVRDELKELFRDEHPMNEYAEKAYMSLIKALTRYQEVEQKTWDNWFEYLMVMRKELGIKHSSWSIMDVDFDEPHPWPSAMYVKRSTWEDDNPIAVKVNGKTWGDLWQASDEAMGKSDNKHHVFIESFHPSKEEKTLIISCGS